MYFLKPVVFYNDDRSVQNYCEFCGRPIYYTHIIINEKQQEIRIGQCCMRKLFKSHKIKKQNLNGYYDWKPSDLRREAKYLWEKRFFRNN